MAAALKVGYFQTIEYSSPASVVIVDKIHGTHVITEDVLIELLQSRALLRLSGVCQAGISGLLGLTPMVTRFEHSVGAFLIVRKAGAKVDEQIAALLHDISHTVFSHVMDWALSAPGESFHEVHKDRYLEKTELPDILKKHGYTDLKPFQEELFPLVEYPAPHLCADRLDYSLRDTAAFKFLSLEDIHEILRSVTVHPDVSSEKRFLVIRDTELALKLARAYLIADRDVWSNPAHVDMTQRAGKIIGDMIRDGRINEDTCWTVSDREFWEALRIAAKPDELQVIKDLESKGLPDEATLRLPKATKVRTLNPDVYPPRSSEPVPLSQAMPQWSEELQGYILARQALKN